MILTLHDLAFIAADGALTDEAREWYLDVCDGRIDLLEDHRGIFFELLARMGQGTFFEDSTQAFMFAFARAQAHFHDCCN